MEHACEKSGVMRSSLQCNLHCWRPCLGVRKCQPAIWTSFCPDHLQGLQSCWDFQRGTCPCSSFLTPSISSLRAPWQAGCQAQVTMCLWQWCEELPGSIWAPDPFSAEQFFTLSWHIQLSTRVSTYCPQAATNRYGRGTAGDTAICTSAGSSLCHC